MLLLAMSEFVVLSKAVLGKYLYLYRKVKSNDSLDPTQSRVIMCYDIKRLGCILSTDRSTVVS